MPNTKLSPAQRRFLDTCAREGTFPCPFLGNRDAGRAASAWHRTANSLERKGLVTVTRRGDGFVARLTTTN